MRKLRFEKVFKFKGFDFEQIEELTEENTSLKTQLLRLKKRAALLSHERDSIRKILQVCTFEPR